MDRTNQVIVITGAASGIGFALAKCCAARGMHVVMADCNADVLFAKVEALQLQASGKILGVICDVTVKRDLAQLAKQTIDCFESVDILVNNAGIVGPIAPIWEVAAEDLQCLLDVNLNGVLHGLQAFLPIMFAQDKRSHVVNMSSFYGLCSNSQLAPYTISKHAIMTLTESLYFDLRRMQKPVDVSVVCPAFTNTGLLKDTKYPAMNALMQHGRDSDELAQNILTAIDQKTFYILPDPEVKNFFEQRAQAILNQTLPHEHSFEKLMGRVLSMEA